MPKLADEYSLDIPHVSAVELPLIVENEDQAIQMLGGKQQISKVINSNTTSIDVLQSDNKELQLELRLRNDRFHHPIMSSKSTQEKILLKVCMPKSNLPEDYRNLGLDKILQHNQQLNGEYLIQPVGIINQTYSFKSMNDFQVSTKNNPLVNDINDNLINSTDFEAISQFFKDGKFINNEDYKNPNVYVNNDHQLPPPAILSTIRQPYDYQYTKNAFTETIKDPNSGELKVRNKRDIPKLYSKVLDINDLAIPTAPAPQLVERYKELSTSQLYPNSFNYDLLGCIEWLKEIFEMKPIWLRKHLENIVPEQFKRTLKNALPYVTYIYKSGPWRFCNIKIGVDPKASRDYWIFQSEYFRVSKFNTKKTSDEEPSKMSKTFPRSLQLWNPESLSKTQINKVKIDDKLIFQGNMLPNTVTYQIGDIIDEDILRVVGESQVKGQFFRDTIDLKQDGWLDRQILETIRRIIKYKLIQLIKDEPIDPSKIQKLISSVYINEGEKHDDDDIDPELRDYENDHDDSDQEIDPEPSHEYDHVGYTEEDEQLQSDDIETAPSQTQEQILDYIKQVDSVVAEKLSKLTHVIKQESFM